jgi:hypothetical protein
VITLVARPGKGAAQFDISGGAYVNAFIDASDETEATAIADREVRDAGWIPESIENTVYLCREDYEENDPNLAYFDQALIDKEVLVFHSWPNDPADEDRVH